MVLYREQKRRSPWFWVGGIVAFVAMLSVALVLLNVLSKPSDEERLSEAVQQMTAQLDVLAISHYTVDALSEGAASPEYAAAVEDIRRILDEWETVDELIDPAAAADVRLEIERLGDLVDQLAPVADVEAKADQLVDRLRTLEVAGP